MERLPVRPFKLWRSAHFPGGARSPDLIGPLGAVCSAFPTQVRERLFLASGRITCRPMWNCVCPACRGATRASTSRPPHQ